MGVFYAENLQKYLSVNSIPEKAPLPCPTPASLEGKSE